MSRLIIFFFCLGFATSVWAKDDAKKCCEAQGGLDLCKADGTVQCKDGMISNSCKCDIDIERIRQKSENEADDDFEPMLDGESLGGFDSWGGGFGGC